jgi:hypothetical protein
VVRWLAFLLRIRDIQESNLGPGTGYSYWGSCVAFLSPASQRGIVTQTRTRQLPSASFAVHYSLIILSLDAIEA